MQGCRFLRFCNSPGLPFLAQSCAPSTRVFPFLLLADNRRVISRCAVLYGPLIPQMSHRSMQSLPLTERSPMSQLFIHSYVRTATSTHDLSSTSHSVPTTF